MNPISLDSVDNSHLNTNVPLTYEQILKQAEMFGNANLPTDLGEVDWEQTFRPILEQQEKRSKFDILKYR